jgi:hypothetical protein
MSQPTIDLVDCIISVETVDGWVDLNGPQGIEKLPWAAPVYVITAWSPTRSVVENYKWQEALCNDLWASGLAIHQAFSRKDTNSGLGVQIDEDYVAVSGLSVDEARRIGVRYGQQTIFAVDDNSIMLLECHQDHGIGRSRLVP